MTPPFVRDRQTWVAYALMAWFAYLQAAPGLVVPHLRAELGIGYSLAGLHVASFAAGSLAGGLSSTAADRVLGRTRVLWVSAAVLATGTVLLATGQRPALTVTGTCVMGLGAGLILSTIQAVLSDRHGDRRTVALTEANVASSLAYLALVAAFAVSAAVGAGWRAALVVPLAVPVLLWATSSRRRPTSPPAQRCPSWAGTTAVSSSDASSAAGSRAGTTPRGCSPSPSP